MTERSCAFDGCDKSGRYKRGLCPAHYEQWRRNPNRTGATICKEPDCNLVVHSKGICINHYQLQRKHDGKWSWKQTYGLFTCIRCGEQEEAPRPARRQYCTQCLPIIKKIKKKTRDLVLYTGPRPQRTYTPQHIITSRRLTSGQCWVCSTWFVSFHLDVTCSPECWNKRHDEQRQIGKDRRRARKKAAYIADVYRKEVFAGDGYRCQLCKKKTDPTKQAPHPMAPTIDHIIPLAAGGTHEPANCFTAHFKCNSLKGDRGGGEQLRLIG